MQGLVPKLVWYVGWSAFSCKQVWILYCGWSFVYSLLWRRNMWPRRHNVVISGAALLPHDLLYDVILSGAAPRSTAAALAHAQPILFQLRVYVIYLLRRPQTHFSVFFFKSFLPETRCLDRSFFSHAPTRRSNPQEGNPDHDNLQNLRLCRQPQSGQTQRCKARDILLVRIKTLQLSRVNFKPVRR